MPFLYYGFDPTYILVILSMVIVSIAQIRVSSAFRKYGQISNRNGLTGYDVARRILDSNGLQHIKIERIAGNLTDHYSPSEGIIRLSDSVINSTSVAAVGVAAHEAGHAVQYGVGYAPIKLRNAIIPITKIGSALAWPLFFIGLFFSAFSFLTDIGIILFLAVVLFQLLTLPVEFNASSRALKILSNGVLAADEVPMAKRVLSAAAMTYVAALLSSVLTLLRLILLSNNRRR